MRQVDARTKANREKAGKGMGPNSAEGKVRSRANTFRHELPGAGVAWPDEDQAELDAFVAGRVAAARAIGTDIRDPMVRWDAGTRPGAPYEDQPTLRVTI